MIERGRRADSVFARIAGLSPQSFRQLDLPLVPESRPELSRGSLDTHQPRIRGADENRVARKRDTAIGEVAVIAIARDMQIRFSDFAASVGIERNHESAGRRDV